MDLVGVLVRVSVLFVLYDSDLSPDSAKDTAKRVFFCFALFFQSIILSLPLCEVRLRLLVLF
jgi:hypothetical protein